MIDTQTTSEPEQQIEVKPERPAARGDREQHQQQQQPDDLNDCSILLRRFDDQAVGRHLKKRQSAGNVAPKQDQPCSSDQGATLKRSPEDESGDNLAQQQLAIAVPKVSVAAYDEDGNWTRLSWQEGRQDRKRCTHSARHDAESSVSSDAGASTTSDVNSNDGAESIASRLSQIVDEQEFLMNHALASATKSGLAGNAGNKSSPDFQTSHGTGDDRTQNSLQHLPQTPEVAKTRNTGTSEHKQARPLENNTVSGKQWRYRTKSFAGQALSGEPPSARKLAERRNESSGSICPSVGGSGGGSQFQPERGDLRSLKQALNSASERQQSFEQSNSGELMLNIRRSAWKLDEFEQAFKPSELENESVDSQANNDQDSTGDPDRTRVPFERQTMSTSSGKNLLIRTSRRLALSRQRSGLAGETAQQSSCKSPVNMLLNNNGKRRFSHSDMSSNKHHNYQLHQPPLLVQAQNQCQQQASNNKNMLANNFKLDELRNRRSSGISMASFASSFDSSRTARRPFGALGSLLMGSTPRHRCNKSQPDDHRDDSGGCQCSTPSLSQYVPVLEWLPAYSWRQDFLGDLTAGLAVAALNISTSLSAAVVAETELGVAFRSSIFNTFVYALLCSSRHSSFGSWSIMSQMLLDSVRRALGDELILNRINLGPQASWNEEEYEMWHRNIIIMYTFLIGLVQLLAGLLNLGNILASFIPEALCSSMIAATAFTMAIGQLANMCGTSNKILWAVEKNTTELTWADLKQPVSITDLFAGLFRWIQQIALLMKHYDQINLIACLISLTTVILLFLNQSYLQKKLKVWFKKDNLFIPFEMILLIVWICAAYALELRDKYHVTTCGPIFIEFNLPNVPNLRLVRELWLDSLATALISYTMVFIMAKTYSNKFNYEINGNQELVACGAGNLIGGLFDALPATASFSRTAGQVEAGGRTQMASLINCATLVILAQYLGHHVTHLPVCVMSATLFFGFVRMMTRTREALVYWRLCKVDFAIWFFTFGAIITFDLVKGFLYGFIFSLLTMLYRAQNRRCYLLGSIGSSDVYVPLPKYPLAHELDGIKIFQFCGPIHYVCADLFERLLRQKTRVNVKELLKQIEEQQQQNQSDKSTEYGTANKSALKPPVFNPRDMNLPTHIILDFSMISNLDTAGIRIIKKIIVDYQRVNITIMLASLASHVAQMVKSDPSLWEAYKDRFYLTIADAVQHALRDSMSASSLPVSKIC